MPSYTTIAEPVTAEIEEKKSRFVAILAPAASEEQARGVLEEARAAHRAARHHAYAYLLNEGGAGAQGRMRYSDDGEPQKTAGLPALECIRHAGLSDVVAVVSRYFGGVLLGCGGLARAYTSAVQACLDQADRRTMSLCVDVFASVDYAAFDPVRRLAHAGGAKLIDAQFEETVKLHLRVVDGKQEALLAKLSRFQGASRGLSVGEPGFRSF